MIEDTCILDLSFPWLLEVTLITGYSVIDPWLYNGV